MILDKLNTRIVRNYQRQETTVFDETNGTSGWTNSGGSVGTGIAFSGSGGMTTKIEYNKEFYLDAETLIAEVVINDDASKFAIAKNTAFRGNVATVDLSGGNLYLGVLATANVEPTYEFSTPITVSIVEGETYVLEFTQKRNITTVKFYRKGFDGTYDRIYRDYDIDDTFAGSGWGKPAFIFFSGDIVFARRTYKGLNISNPYIACFGDSITEGYTLIDQTGNVKSRWDDKLWVANKGNVVISGKGGATSTNLDGWINNILEVFTPKYSIIFIGSNDSTYATWETRINNIIGKVEAVGSIPVVCTVLPRTDNQTAINSMNSYIDSTLASSCDVIDFAAAVTDSRDRLTWTSGYLMGDNVHPTVAGHLAMYNEIVNNNSYLIQ